MSLPVRHIIIEERQLHTLQKNVWSDEFVEAQLKTSGCLVPIKLRYRGGHTRNYPKKSYEIVKDGKTFHYNAEYDDPSMIRNALSFRFFEWLGVPSPKTKHCQLRMNGESLGVYLQIEAVDRNFFRKRGIPVRALIYAVNDGGNFSLNEPDSSRRKKSLFQGYRLMIGHPSERKRLSGLISRLHTLPAGKLPGFLKTQVDIDNYLRWLAGAVFTGNYDGFEQNYALFRRRGSSKYVITPWDYEGTWGRNCYGKRVSSDLVRVTGYNELTGKLLAIRSVRERYKQVLRQGLQSAFTSDRLMPEIKRLHESIAPYIYQDRARRWPFSTFEEEPELIGGYIAERRRLIKQELEKL
jgi:spore coat protein H